MSKIIFFSGIVPWETGRIIPKKSLFPDVARTQIVVTTMVSIPDVSEVNDYDKNIKGDIRRAHESFHCSDADGYGKGAALVYSETCFHTLFVESLKDNCN